MTQPARRPEAARWRREGPPRRGPWRRSSRRRRSTAPRRSATSCWSGHTGSGKTTLVEALLAGDRARSRAPARSRTAPRSATTIRPRSTSSARSSLSVAPLDHDGDQGQPARHPRLRRLRRRAAGRSARRRRGAVRGLRRRRRRRDHDRAVGGVRRGRHAARGRGHPAGRTAGRLRGDGRRLPAGVRRRTCCRSTCRCTRTTARIGGLIGLLSQHRATTTPAAARVERAADPEHLRARSTARATR